MTTPTHAVTLYQDTPDPVDPAVLGGKGAGLFNMVSAGVPVPEAIVLTTEAWKEYRETGHLAPDLKDAVAAFLSKYPDSMFSVRSGAPVSMPGMMDTVLNVGVTPELDAMYEGAYRRFASSWLTIVKGVGKPRVSYLMDKVNARAQGDPSRFRKVLHAVIQAAEHVSVPDSREDQVLQCVEAVFNSWDTPRAKAYRAMHGIDENMGTACVVQRMVMGTAPGFSGSGVMFSRDPATGEPKVRGEFAMGAQGEEVVSGEVTPVDLDDLFYTAKKQHNELCMLAMKLEKTYGDVQDIEFTYENGHLYALQTRTAKMSARARIETACALADTLYPQDAAKRLEYLRQRVTKAMVAKTCVPTVNTKEAPALSGLGASPGAVSGKIVFRTTPLKKVDKSCILVAEDTAPEDFPIMAKVGGILTKTGGFTCHSAVVARGIGVPAVVGAETLKLDSKGIEAGHVYLHEGSIITIDGAAGLMWAGEKEVTDATPPRSIYTALDAIVKQGGYMEGAEPYYYDSGLGNRVVLPINPADFAQVERQLERYERYEGKGKTVGFAVQMHALGEDLFDEDPLTLFGALAYHYGADFKGKTILYGVPKALRESVQTLLGVHYNNEAVHVLDLLDALGA